MKVFAHRGDSGKYPENTMLAFEKAADSGCDGIELDVQLTQDGTVVIIHDERIDRTTDGTGFVRDYTYESIRKFDAAVLFRKEYKFEPIPSFDEYCSWVRDKGLITNIELKTGVYYYEGLEEKTLEIVKKYHLEEKVIISSFNHLSAIHMKKLEPRLVCGALISSGGLENAGSYCRKYGFEYYHPSVIGLTALELAACRANGIRMNVWTVNDKEAVRTLAEWGCDGVITNFPAKCMEWIK